MRNTLKNICLGFGLSLLLLTAAQAADFKWMDGQGDIKTLAEEYKGHPVLVHFWASWCPPCVAEMPEMSAWLKQHPEVKVLPVSLDNDLETAQRFLKEQHIPLRALLTDSAQAGRMGVRGLPTSMLITSAGSIEASFIGAQDWNNQAWKNQILAFFTPKGQ